MEIKSSAKLSAAVACLALGFFWPGLDAGAAVETTAGGANPVALTVNSPAPGQAVDKDGTVLFSGRVWRPGGGTNFGRCARLSFFIGSDRDEPYGACSGGYGNCAPTRSCVGGENKPYASAVQIVREGSPSLYKLGEMAVADPVKIMNSGDYAIEFSQAFKLPPNLASGGKARFYIQYSGIGMDGSGAQTWQWLIAYQPVIIGPVPDANADSAPRITAESALQTDYCTSAAGPAAILYWSWVDQPEANQSAYQVQVSLDPEFSNAAIDSGKIESATTSYATPLGKLLYDKRYYWRVRVWNAKSASAWSPGADFATPLHPYPAVKFDWSPKVPLVSDRVVFTDKSVIGGNKLKAGWSWVFGGGTPGISRAQNPALAFEEKGIKKITLTITDSSGYSCSASRVLQVDPIYPE